MVRATCEKEMSSEVALWLERNNLSALTPALQREGFDDLEDLKTIIEDSELFLRIVPGAGHRSKLKRLLGALAASEPEAAKPLATTPEQPGAAKQAVPQAEGVLHLTQTPVEVAPFLPWAPPVAAAAPAPAAVSKPPAFEVRLPQPTHMAVWDYDSVPLPAVIGGAPATLAVFVSAVRSFLRRNGANSVSIECFRSPCNMSSRPDTEFEMVGVSISSTAPAASQAVKRLEAFAASPPSVVVLLSSSACYIPYVKNLQASCEVWLIHELGKETALVSALRNPLKCWALQEVIGSYAMTPLGSVDPIAAVFRQRREDVAPLSSPLARTPTSNKQTPPLTTVQSKLLKHESTVFSVGKIQFCGMMLEQTEGFAKLVEHCEQSSDFSKAPAGMQICAEAPNCPMGRGCPKLHFLNVEAMWQSRRITVSCRWVEYTEGLHKALITRDFIPDVCIHDKSCRDGAACSRLHVTASAPLSVPPSQLTLTQGTLDAISVPHTPERSLSLLLPTRVESAAVNLMAPAPGQGEETKQPSVEKQDRARALHTVGVNLAQQLPLRAKQVQATLVALWDCDSIPLPAVIGGAPATLAVFVSAVRRFLWHKGASCATIECFRSPSNMSCPNTQLVVGVSVSSTAPAAFQIAKRLEALAASPPSVVVLLSSSACYIPYVQNLQASCEVWLIHELGKETALVSALRNPLKCWALQEVIGSHTTKPAEPLGEVAPFPPCTAPVAAAAPVHAAVSKPQPSEMRLPQPTHILVWDYDSIPLPTAIGGAPATLAVFVNAVRSFLRRKGANSVSIECFRSPYNTSSRPDAECELAEVSISSTAPAAFQVAQRLEALAASPPSVVVLLSSNACYIPYVKNLQSSCEVWLIRESGKGAFLVSAWRDPLQCWALQEAIGSYTMAPLGSVDRIAPVCGCESDSYLSHTVCTSQARSDANHCLPSLYLAVEQALGKAAEKKSRVAA